jgi:parallel beta-helix repeat protein
VSKPLIESLEDRVLLSSYYVSASAGTGGNGSSGSPWDKIQTALNHVVAGDIINVRDGVYREELNVQAGRSGTAGNLLTIQADTGAHPILTGSDAVTGWVNYSGNIWMKTGWTTNSQQVFDDGAPLQQIGRPPNPPYDPSDGRDEFPDPVGTGLADMAPGRFFYDPATSRLYVQLADNSNPNSSAMEASKRARIFFAEPDRGYIKLKGLTFQHSNSSSIREQDAMVTLSSHSIADGDTFQYGDFTGLTLGWNTTGVQVMNSSFLNNGALGISGPGSQDFSITNSIIRDNNYRGFNRLWNAGGIKITSSGAYGVIEGNEVDSNNGSGIWFDFASGTPSVITGNYIHDNGPTEAGIFYEASFHGVISNNVLVNNNRRGIYVNGSDDVKVFNNTIVGQQGNSAIEVGNRNGTLPSTNTLVKNNLISGGTSTTDLFLSPGTGNASDYNDVYRSTGGRFSYNGATKTLAQMQSLGLEAQTTTPSPAFASTSGDDYSLSAASAARDAGTTLSPDVTSDYAGTARPQGSAYDMGAYEYINAVSTGPVGYWALDENTGTTTADASGNGNNGTLQNGVAWTAPGKAGAAALTFDGTNDRVLISTSSSLEATTAMSIGGWFNHASTGGSGTSGVTKAQNYRLTAQEANAASSHWQFFFTDSNGTIRSITTTNAYSNDVWHYVMGTYDGTQLKIYVDGVSAAPPVNFTGAIKVSTASVFLGLRDATAYYAGQMDEIRIYNRALSASEVAALANPTDPSLVGYWKLDENTGTTTADASGNGNDGTLVNGVAWTAPGKVGAADLSFDGTNDRVLIPTSSELEASTALSIGGWFNHSSTGGAGTSGVTKAQNYRLTAQEANAANSHWQFFFTDSNGTIRSITTTNAYSNDAWHYVMGTYDGSQLKIYVDGASAATPVSFTGTIKTSAADVFLGLRDASAYYKGQMDEIRIYNRGLSSSEVAALYSASGTGMLSMKLIPATSPPYAVAPMGTFSNQLLQFHSKGTYEALATMMKR